MKNLVYYKLEVTTDGAPKLLGAFATEALVRQISIALKQLNRPIGYGLEITETHLEICESIGDFDYTLDLTAREKALAKLDTEDRLALGLLGSEGPNG